MCAFDRPALGNAQPLYPDTVDYSSLENNAEFLIYEGTNVVGKGRVLGRTTPYKAVSYTHLDVYKRQAMEVLERRKLHGVHVVITDKLPETDISAGSAAEMLVIPT